MITKTNAPPDPTHTANKHEETRHEISALLERAEAELVGLKKSLSTITADDDEACGLFEGFARRLSRASGAVGLGVLQSSAGDLVALIENRHRSPAPAAKFRFLLFTSLELIAIELRRIRSDSAN